ncbi:uncharacterized protein LOC125723056 [Brienomyrus brachyistius]|uniref:uncharacterized protein LOC125723056 n=1 Tax=Brienomyrus brachyistius TaxID=42636 RepID=UPI0020B39BB5|nr:uncharacterized protein LOC125723056 [Brienomyrus brachyistius]XP_048855431.1 uncharacterized protein LOC125723056 [Brienomyrus brachyistius]XP_048855432.1 uncharacterized protein LOC125723056 [Brienomyrus brachyistius]XP_048855433.1 uncharacterized protein LOC125723056 [Brienomyrus brachyistius]XP_048855434.1 uncharacterized protein LOC125723056 [Brienomyrus brachyistius]XP_048855435.1 uncharacterized protein LOC125723056 [Brienomyrus brachyistius]XP_048855436.1 uncharacterized protein LO
MKVYDSVLARPLCRGRKSADWRTADVGTTAAEGLCSSGDVGGPSRMATAGGPSRKPFSGPWLVAGGGLRNTARFCWRAEEEVGTFPDRLAFIREVAFKALGLHILCVQRNGPFQFFEVTLSTDESYTKVLERSKEGAQHPLLGRYNIEPLWWPDKRVITVHCFNPHVTAEAVSQFLTKYVDLLPGHRDIRDELGIWTGRRQFQARLRPDANGAGGFSHPPAYFTLQGNKAYLFYSGQPPFCLAVPQLWTHPGVGAHGQGLQGPPSLHSLQRRGPSAQRERLHMPTLCRVTEQSARRMVGEL